MNDMEQILNKGVNFREQSQPRIVRQIVNPVNNPQPGTSYAQVAGGGRQRSMSRTKKQTSNEKNEKPNKIKRPVQPLKAFNPAVSLAQAFAAAPINLANRFTILSTAEAEDRGHEIINEIQSSTQLASVNNSFSFPIK